MALDYKKIRDDKTRDYGLKVGNVGRLLASLYSDRTHFILELLQNAEDALRNRGPQWNGSREVSFHLKNDQLVFVHCGRPFDESDVRGICEIGESAKNEDLTAIGRFGIGFKSVYAITDRPEIHSGTEDFTIENFVLPDAVPRIERDKDDTVFILPLKSNGESAYEDIAAGLEGLGATSLLFLRQIEEIHWDIDDGRKGSYLRIPESLDEGVRRVTVLGQVDGNQEISTDWLVFSRPVTSDEGSPVGDVEIAFSLDPVNRNIQPVVGSRLVVFFPTTLETHLGFLLQGPYQTTPSRDNVPPNVEWNKHLIEESSNLMLRALRWLRDKDQLTTEVLSCLPINPRLFGINAGQSLPDRPGNRSLIDANMFAPLFDVTKRAFSTEPLLPRHDSGYVSSGDTLLGRTDGLRQLFSNEQLSSIYGDDREMAWLSGDITQDRTPEIREYLMRELQVEEIVPESITRRLTRAFLQEQCDSWIQELYEFLNEQPAIIRMLNEQLSGSYRVDVPLIRLADGTHASLGRPKAFLPSDSKTEFPAVRAAACKSPGALSFLRSLGLREPDLVDDVIQNVLPKYQKGDLEVDDAEYEADFARISQAFATDSHARWHKLVDELERSEFVKSVAPGTYEKYLSMPDEVYLATAQMKDLFAGVNEVRLVDDGYSCLRGEDASELLEQCGASLSLKPVRVDSNLTRQQLREMRGGDGSTREDKISDWTLLGLDELLNQLRVVSPELQRKKASMLWQALIDLAESDGKGSFNGTYEWHYYSWQRKNFPASFVRLLNDAAWVPNEDNELRSPDSVVLASLGWEEHPFLISHIAFRQPEPPIVYTLAKEVGIEPESLDLIKEHGVTTEKLREWLGLTKDLQQSPLTSSPSEREAIGRINGRRYYEGRADDGSTESAFGRNPSSELSEPSSMEANTNAEPFAKLMFGDNLGTSRDDPAQPVTLPDGGPLTEASAGQHTIQSGQYGRSGTQIMRSITRWEPTEAAQALANEFKTMVHGDYDERCQICGKTFKKRNEELQAFVVHVVKPAGDSRTNHLGDLMSLCGEHFALVRYGKWHWLNPETGAEFVDSGGREAWEHWRTFVLGAADRDAEKTDDDENTYIGLPIRFSDIYEEWNSGPRTLDSVVRYCRPHWIYLCKLIDG